MRSYLLAHDREMVLGMRLAGIEGEPDTGRLRPSVTAYLDLSEELCGMSFRQGCLNIAEHYREISTSEGRRLTVYYTDRACDLGDGEACALSEGEPTVLILDQLQRG